MKVMDFVNCILFGAFALAFLKFMKDVVQIGMDILKLLKYMKGNVEGCYDKLAYLERRMMQLVQPGAETARLLHGMLEEYQPCRGDCRWMKRTTLDIYQEWFSARSFREHLAGTSSEFRLPAAPAEAGNGGFA